MKTEQSIEKLQQLTSNYSESEKLLAKRAYDTLYSNIISPEGDIKDFVFGSYRGIVPSPRTYKGVWNWDAAFHLIGMSRFDTETAKDQARIMFKYQLPNGQLPDVVYSNGNMVTKFTKPPVFAWAIVCGNKIDDDADFLTYAYPYLLKNLTWWETERYDGLLFSYKVHAMESGWDNSVRFDYPNKVYNLYAIDCNCFMVSFYDSMKYMAGRLGFDSDAEQFELKSKELASKINERLYDKDLNAYCDYNRKRKTFTKQLSPASFLPMFFGIADKEKAEKMKDLANNKKYFYNGIPTISYNNRKFKSGAYWRGPCWLNTAYFVIRGLYNYGYKPLAAELSDNILGWCAKNEDCIYEYYDSISGQGLGAKDFGWSSVFIIELLQLRHNITDF